MASVEVDAAGLPVRCLVEGEGAPLVLLHGFPQTAHEWRRVVPALRRRHTVIAPDLRGFGGTGRPYPPRISRGLLARDLAATLDALGVGGPVDLAGHDWGGLVAFTFALRHRGRVRRLVLIDTALTRVVIRAVWHFVWFKVPGLAERTLAHASTEFVLGALLGLCRTPGTFTEEDLEVYAAGFRNPSTQRIAISYYRHGLPLYRVVPDPSAPHGERFQRVTLEECRRWWEGGPERHPFWRQTMDVAPADRHRRLDVPCLWVYATGLGRPNAAFRAQFEEAFPDLRTLELDCGHWIPEERPEELVEAMASFLGR